MDRRTKILASAFGVVVAYVVAANVVYPYWIEPTLNIDERIQRMKKEYAELTALEKRVDSARDVYRDLVGRVGGFDISKVTTDVRARLNRLIEQHRLQNADVTPSRPSEDRKTGVTSFQITITAIGTLESVIKFMRDAAELPQLVRMGNAALYPASRGRRPVGPTMMNIRLPIEVLVLPQKRIVGKIDLEALEQPTTVVRHMGRDYSAIWSGEPFTEPIPLRVIARGEGRVRVGDRVQLSATVTGGKPPYQIRWSPAQLLRNPTDERPLVDTTKDGTHQLEVMVRDARGERATASVQVVVIDPTPAEPTGAPSRVADPGPQRWPDGRYRQVRMTLLSMANGQRVEELMLFHGRANQNQYFKVGDPFDGGELVFVHPRGGVVRRGDAYFIYPIGAFVSQDVPVGEDSAAEYPDLTAVAQRLQQADQDAKAKAAKESAGAQPDQQPAAAATVQPSAADAKAVAAMAESEPAGSEPEVVDKRKAGRTGGAQIRTPGGKSIQELRRQIRRNRTEQKNKNESDEAGPGSTEGDGAGDPGKESEKSQAASKDGEAARHAKGSPEGAKSSRPGSVRDKLKRKKRNASPTP